MYVLKTTQSVVNPELPLVAVKMMDGLSVIAHNEVGFRGTIGICRKSIIANLPGEVQAAKHCLAKLEKYVDAIIHALEK